MNKYYQTIKLIIGHLDVPPKCFFEDFLGISARGYNNYESGRDALVDHFHKRIVEALNKLLNQKFSKYKDGDAQLSQDRAFKILSSLQWVRKDPWAGVVLDEVSLLKLYPNVKKLPWAEPILKISSLPNQPEVQPIATSPLVHSSSVLQVSTDKVHVKIQIDANFAKENPEHVKQLIMFIKKRFENASIEYTKPSSVEYGLEMSRQAAEGLLHLFQGGELKSLFERRVISIRIDETPGSQADHHGPLLEIAPDQMPTAEDINYFLASNWEPYEPRSFLQKVKESAVLLFKLFGRQSRGLPMPFAKFSLIPSLLAQAYSMLWFQGDSLVRRTVRQAYVNTFVLWPIASAAITVLLGIALTGKFDISICLWAATSATLMAMAGSLVCGPLFSILGVGAGGVLFAIAFGVTQILLAQWMPNGLQGIADHVDTTSGFISVVNGVVGTLASEVDTSIRRIIVLVPASMAIIGTAWLMGNPISYEDNRQFNLRRLIWGTVFGIFAGGGIGLVKGLFVLLGQSPTAFCVSAVLVGTPAYGLCVWLRTGEIHRSMVYGLLYGALGALLWGSAMVLKGTIPGLFINGLGTGLFHACYFTLAYAIGFKIGGRRAAFMAAALEGVIGFVVFNIILMLQH